MAELFNITHDADNLDEYDSTVTDAGNLSTGTPGLASTTAKLEALIDDTTPIYGQMTVSSPASNQLRLRFYVDPNSMTIPNYATLTVLLFTGERLVHVELYNNNGTYAIVTRAVEDDWSYPSLGAQNITDAEHYVEIHVIAHATAGSVTQWIDGEAAGALTALDNDAMMDGVTYVRFGAAADIDAGIAGTLHLDELLMNDDGSEIGPVTAAVTGYATVF